MPTPREFPCPDCGSTEDWKADYYNAVFQSCTVIVGEDGQPEVDEFLGDEDSYDDGCTEDEAIVCQDCGYRIEFGAFRMLTPKDGRLFDKAPDMLKALQLVVSECESYEAIRELIASIEQGVAESAQGGA
jgi:hypothetical protein